MQKLAVMNDSLPCPLCRHAAPAAGTTAGLLLHRCGACRVGFLNTAPRSLEQYAAELEAQYFGSEFVARENFWTARYEASNNRVTLRRLPAPETTAGRRLLEIGIGSGRFLGDAARAGWQVAGIEMSPAVAAHARERYGVPVFTGDVAAYDGSLGEQFDVVVMNHVLEHMADPRRGLTDVRRLLGPRGVLHLAVPNADCWEARLSGWVSYQPYHLYYFNRESLTRLVRGCGFDVQRVEFREPFSGWVNAVMHTMAGANRSAKAEASSPPTDAPGARVGLARNLFEVARLAVGGALLPVRYVQCAVGKGEEIILMLRPDEVRA